MIHSLKKVAENLSEFSQILTILFLVCLLLLIWCFSDFYSRFFSISREIIECTVFIEKNTTEMCPGIAGIYVTMLMYRRAIFV